MTAPVPPGILGQLASAHAWLPPGLLVIHLLSAALVIGSVTAFDLRVLGVWRQVSVQELHRVLIPLALVAVVPAAASGSMLYSLHADALIGDGVFVLKILALFAAAINAMIFATGPWQSVKQWPDRVAPLGARLSALLSLALLGSIGALGVTLVTRLAQR